jgi:hypothetical protein
MSCVLFISLFLVECAKDKEVECSLFRLIQNNQHLLVSNFNQAIFLKNEQFEILPGLMKIDADFCKKFVRY